MSRDILNATIVHRRDLHERLMILRVRPDHFAIPDFKPGQFATLGLPPRPDEAVPKSMSVRPRLIRRVYSIASPPHQKDYLEFFIVRIPEGQFTSHLWTLHEGDRLWLDPRIRGEFTLAPIPEETDLLMVATGTGVAPFLCMLRTCAGTQRWRRCVLAHGVRFACDLGYYEELTQLSQTDPTLTYLPLCSREPDDSPWPGLRGRVQKLLLDTHDPRLTDLPLDPERTHAMVCGNPDMVLSMQQMLEDHGFTLRTYRQPGNLHIERYW